MAAKEAWMQHGSCTTHPNPDLWYPEKPNLGEQRRQAKAICKACPVVRECLDWALREFPINRGEGQQPSLVIGGVSGYALQKMRDELGIPHPDPSTGLAREIIKRVD